MRLHLTLILAAAAVCLVPVDSAPGALVGWWKLDDGASDNTTTTALNSGTLGASADGSLRNMTPTSDWITDRALLPPRINTLAALEFEGGNEFVNIDGYKGITGTGARTAAMWVKTSLTQEALISWGSNSTGQKWTFRTQDDQGPYDGVIRAEVAGGYVVGNTIITDDTWHHVAVTWEDDGSPNIVDAKLYVDGYLDGQNGTFSAQSGQAINTASGSDVRLGAAFSAGNVNFVGMMDDVRIYDEALSAAQIHYLVYTPEPSTILIWSLLAALGITFGRHKRRKK